MPGVGYGKRAENHASGTVFHSDEMRLSGVDPKWSEAEFLKKEGIFYLKDVANKLEVPSAEIKKMALALEKKGGSGTAWEQMGVRKTWTHWIVRMTVFSKFFESMATTRIRRVSSVWDGNTLLAQKGRFFLTEVCEKIPFTPDQIRYQARHNPDSQKEFGVWKETKHKSYLVDMETFSKWITAVWRSGLNLKTDDKTASQKDKKVLVG